MGRIELKSVFTEGAGAIGQGRPGFESLQTVISAMAEQLGTFPKEGNPAAWVFVAIPLYGDNGKGAPASPNLSLNANVPGISQEEETQAYKPKRGRPKKKLLGFEKSNMDAVPDKDNLEGRASSDSVCNKANPERLIDIKEIAARLGVGKTTVYRMVEDGLLPKPIKLGSSMVRWKESELDERLRKMSSE